MRRYGLIVFTAALVGVAGTVHATDEQENSLTREGCPPIKILKQSALGFAACELSVLSMHGAYPLKFNYVEAGKIMEAMAQIRIAENKLKAREISKEDLQHYTEQNNNICRMIGGLDCYDIMDKARAVDPSTIIGKTEEPATPAKPTAPKKQ